MQSRKRPGSGDFARGYDERVRTDRVTALGEHTDAILQELGYGGKEIEGASRGSPPSRG